MAERSMMSSLRNSMTLCLHRHLLFFLLEIMYADECKHTRQQTRFTVQIATGNRYLQSRAAAGMEERVMYLLA